MAYSAIPLLPINKIPISITDIGFIFFKIIVLIKYADDEAKPSSKILPSIVFTEYCDVSILPLLKSGIKFLFTKLETINDEPATHEPKIILFFL